MGAVLRRFHSPTDTPKETTIKRVMLPCTISLLILNIGVSSSLDEMSLLRVTSLVNLTVNLSSLIKWYITKKITKRDVIIVLCVWLLALTSTDMRASGEMGSGIWPIAVLVLDLVLVCGLPDRVAKSMIAYLVFYLFLKSLEAIFNFGLYEVTSPEYRFFKECLNLSDEQVEALPCKQTWKFAILLGLAASATLLLDFHVTRNFATGLRSEQQKMKSSIDLAEEVVSALVRFDLDDAKISLACSNRTPLTETLEQLIANLEKYRPYLPDSMFEFTESQFVNNVRPPQGEAAVLFTDLKSSTAIWEASPEAMKKALKIHNTIIRTCISDFGGYEVKTIGDSFMVAFEGLEQACFFAMEVQNHLSTATWPSDLKLPILFKKSGWDGLMVRIGVCYGEVEMEVDQTSGRADYFGRIVNRAARLEGACVPGCVAIESSQVDLINVQSSWNQRVIHENLKGIDNAVSITILSNPEGTEVSGSYASTMMSMSDTISCRSSMQVPTGNTLGQLTRKSNATACNVQMKLECHERDESDMQTVINDVLSRSIGCAERSEGSILSVLSSSMAIAWNTARYSPSHFTNALHFASLMHEGFPPSGDRQQACLGIACSPIHCGAVGTKSQRFMTVIGEAINMCGQLCQASNDIGAFALFANAPFDFVHRRPIDVWSKGQALVTIYQLNASKLRGWLISRTTDVVEQTSDWEWSEGYVEAFRDKNWAMILNHQLDDNVLIRVAKMIREGRSLRPSEDEGVDEMDTNPPYSLVF
eukprot:TRINITY_DN1049_c0_g1_i11.p1 TRINITY_DN1049_c0_g1~~TRINITY_DN1049_c0_g1_i11.p1  ORF type:complete len:759 (+),score=131.43 TRINITY_DN1049_c0_g1_i11:81-2357(+)